MGKSLDVISLETEDGINLEHPDVKLFRKVMLEQSAGMERSDLFCPKCNTNLPYNQMTVAAIPAGVDANYNPLHRTAYFCTLCQEYFDKPKA